MVRYLLLLIFGFNNYSIFSQDVWQTFQDKKEGFSVELPGEWRYNEREFPIENQNLKHKNWSLKMEEPHPNYAYLINIIEYPKSIDFAIDDSLILNTILEVSNSQNHQVIYHQKIESSPSFWILRSEDSQKFICLKLKAYSKNNQLYILQVYTTKPQSLNPFIDKFLNSFKFL